LEDKRRHETAEEWAYRQALKAPSWSDEKWERVCALLRIKIAATPVEIGDNANETPHQEGSEEDPNADQPSRHKSSSRSGSNSFQPD
jgi:hypothetical protein